MELALQVVGLKMTGKIEDAKDVAMRIVGSTEDSETTSPDLQISDIMELASGSRERLNMETAVVAFLSLLDLQSPAVVPAKIALEQRTPSHLTLLHLSIHLRMTSLASFLISRGADLNARDVNGFTPLHFSAISAWQPGVDLLLRSGADPEIVDLRGRTAWEASTDSNIHFTPEIGLRRPAETEYSSDEGEDADVEDECGLLPPSRQVYAAPGQLRRLQLRSVVQASQKKESALVIRIRAVYQNLRENQDQQRQARI